MFVEDGHFVFRDSDTDKMVWVSPRRARCAACGERERLCIDHDRWVRRNKQYRTRLLCQRCNLRKGNRRYIPYPDGTMWVPGMRCRQRVPNPWSAKNSR